MSTSGVSTLKWGLLGVGLMLAVVVVLAVLLQLALGAMNQPFGDARKELLDFRSRLQLGMSGSDVLFELAGGANRTLKHARWKDDAGRKVFIASTDVPSAVENWELHIHFANDAVVALKIRSDEGGFQDLPDGAPEDIEASDGTTSVHPQQKNNK